MSSKKFHDAIREKNIQTVQTFLNQGTDVNSKTELTKKNLNTPLHTAVLSKSKEIVKLLLDANADMTAKNKDGHTALQSALERKDFDVASVLIDAGADVNSINDEGQTGLHIINNEYACNLSVEKRVAWVKYFLSKNANVSATDPLGLTPLHCACQWRRDNDLAVIKLLVDAGADVNARSRDGWSALHFAAFNTKLSLVKYLLSVGAHIDEVNNNEQTPLHLACATFFSANDGLRVIICLLKNGADMKTVDKGGWTPIMTMLRYNFHDEVQKKRILKLFVKYSDVNAEDSAGKHVLSILAEFEKSIKETGKIVLEHIAEVHALNLPVSQNVLDTISSNSDYNNYFAQCQDELLRAKASKLKNSWVTYFNLLTDSEKKLKNYAGNKDLVDDLEKTDCLKEFPIYGDSIKKNMKKGIKKRKFFDKSVSLLSNCWPIFGPNHLIIRGTLDCLITKDLAKFLSDKVV